MKINFSVNPVSFGYKSVLKTEWMKGKLPTVKIDPLGDILTKENCTLDHFLAKSKKGKSTLSNYLLMKDTNNWAKGNKDPQDFLTAEGLKKYLDQFIDVKTSKINGNNYIEAITKKAKHLFKDW